MERVIWKVAYARTLAIITIALAFILAILSFFCCVCVGLWSVIKKLVQAATIGAMGKG